MRMSRLLSLCLILVAAPTVAQKVNIDFDGATAFSEFKTFQLQDTAHDLSDARPLLHEKAVARLTTYAIEGGLSEADSDPDVYVAYYVAFSGELSLALSDLDYAYGPGFQPGDYWQGGVGTRETSKKPFVFREGTVVIDVWDRERGILVWRGIATANVKKDATKNEKRLAKAFEKMMKQWEEMYGGRARALRKLKAEQGQ
jgi:hypothetical protein